MNENWTRWIKSSVAKHFDSNVSGITMFVAGSIRPSSEDDHFDLRINGPDYDEVSAEYYFVDVGINALVSCIKSNDLYKPDELKGKVLQGFTDVIEVHEWQDGDAYLTCLRKTGPILIDDFFPVEEGSNVLQSTIECHYMAELEE